MCKYHTNKERVNNEYFGTNAETNAYFGSNKEKKQKDVKIPLQLWLRGTERASKLQSLLPSCMNSD